jgi:chromosome segregation ATPase
MDWGRSEFARPASLALMAIAAIGWLVALYFWMQAVDLRAEGEEALRRTEVARQELVGELQTLQRAVGSAVDLRAKLDAGRKALDDVVAQRSSAQTEFAELTRRIDETQLALASETEDLDSKAALLKDTQTNLKATQDELADLAAQQSAVAAELEKAKAALAEAQAAARAADASAVAAKTAEAEARAKADAAKAELDAIEAKRKAAAPK